MPDSKETVTEALRAVGVETGNWNQTKTGSITPPFWDRQKALLEKLKGLLEGQLAQDKSKVAELREQLERMKHGGGL